MTGQIKSRQRVTDHGEVFTAPREVNAIASIYGVDLLRDNVSACRRRLYGIWNAEYESVCGKQISEDCRKTVCFILDRNIVCGNALSMKKVDENGKDTDDFIVFSEWSFITQNMIQRKGLYPA